MCITRGHEGTVLCRGRDEDGPVPLELYSIYILGRDQGMGLGAALLGARTAASGPARAASAG